MVCSICCSNDVGIQKKSSLVHGPPRRSWMEASNNAPLAVSTYPLSVVLENLDCTRSSSLRSADEWKSGRPHLRYSLRQFRRVVTPRSALRLAIVTLPPRATLIVLLQVLAPHVSDVSMRREEAWLTPPGLSQVCQFSVDNE